MTLMGTARVVVLAVAVALIGGCAFVAWETGGSDNPFFKRRPKGSEPPPIHEAAPATPPAARETGS